MAHSDPDYIISDARLALKRWQQLSPLSPLSPLSHVSILCDHDFLKKYNLVVVNANGCIYHVHVPHLKKFINKMIEIYNGHDKFNSLLKSYDPYVTVGHAMTYAYKPKSSEDTTVIIGYVEKHGYVIQYNHDMMIDINHYADDVIDENIPAIMKQLEDTIDNLLEVTASAYVLFNHDIRFNRAITTVDVNKMIDTYHRLVDAGFIDLYTEINKTHALFVQVNITHINVMIRSRAYNLRKRNYKFETVDETITYLKSVD